MPSVLFLVATIYNTGTYLCFYLSHYADLQPYRAKCEYWTKFVPTFGAIVIVDTAEVERQEPELKGK
jgi:hypothetical protein